MSNTYFVSPHGILVHNCNEDITVTALDPNVNQTATYGGPEAVRAVLDKAELETSCFAGDTLVKTLSGDEVNVDSGTEISHIFDYSLVADIKVGGKVLSRCEVTGEVAFKRILKVFEHESRPVFQLYFTGGEQYEKKFSPLPIDVTAEHPFWIKGKGWVEAANLVAGDEFYSSECELNKPYVVYAENEARSQHGERLLFEKLVPAPYKANVYNIEVEDFHTYFVGFEGIWVHNKNTPVKAEVLRADRFPEATPPRMPEYTPNPNPFQAEVIRREQEIRNTLAKSGLDLGSQNFWKHHLKWFPC